MNYKNTLALLPAAILVACGGGDDQTVNEPATPGSVVYSYPADGQREVSPKADVVLRFSHALTDDDVAGKIRITDGENSVAFTAEGVDGNRSLKISPQEELSPGTEYTVEFTDGLMAENNRAIETPNAVGAEGIQFFTRGGLSGIAGLDNLSSTFEVAEMIPATGAVFQPMDISTFRLRMTQPVHPQWKERGGAIEITDSDGNSVPATVLVKGRLVTIDPCIPEVPEQCGRKDDFLTPGETYIVSMRDLPGINGEVLENFSEEVVPRDTGPRVVLFQEVIDSGLNAGSPETDKSKLNGQVINGVVLNSVLQGTTDISQQTGSLFAELGYAPAFEADEPLPLRIPKGSILSSSNIAVRVNGLVPVIDEDTGSIQQTGNIKVTMVSDATGYLMPNPYTDDQNAPRHVRLFMDIAMNTEEEQPNASLSQDLLGVELAGIALVEDGVLTIDAIGMVEPNLLGQEVTDSTIAFRIEAETDSTSQLDAADQRDEEMEDLTGPELLSWMPGPENAVPSTRQDMQRPGDPIVLNFDEPLDPDSVEGNVTLSTVEGNVGNLNTKVDGTVLVINPQGGLDHGKDYVVTVNGLTDINGNPATVPTLKFSLPEVSDGTEAAPASPLALTTYPGYPCVTENLDIANGNHGTCVDSPDAPAGIDRDQLPVTTLPKDRPIVVKFSQSMDLDTINDNSFVVEKVSDPSSPASVGDEELVTGRLEKNNQQIRFYPDEAWDVGATYRYTMKSDSDAASCGGGEVICSSEQLPLQTDLLVDPSDIGGPNLSIFFTGAESVSSVFTPLRNLPIRDTNSNYVIDCGSPGGTDCLEPFAHDEDGNGGFLPSANAGKLRVIDSDGDGVGDSSAGNARVGCSPDGGPQTDCPENKFIYQTYALDTEVVGPALDENGNEIGVRVLLYPTQLVTTSAKVIVNANLLLGADIESNTGTQILRMTYGEPSKGNPLGLVEGIIREGIDGGPIFETTAELTLDAPNLSGVDSHDVYSKPVTLKLRGDITFFDDGRMQIEQWTTEAEDIIVNAVTFGFVDVEIPLQIPENGVYLNFISNPIKEIPAEY